MAYIVFITPFLNGQGTIPFIAEVGRNNPEILHYEAILRAREAESRTGNTPGPLSLGYGHYPGTPSSAGLKQTIEVSQEFSFPTTYILKGRVTRGTLGLAGEEFRAGRVGVMLEARLLAYEYMKQKRRSGILAMKLSGYDSLNTAWERLASEGAVTALELARLKAELVRARSEAASEEALLTSLRVKLDYLSGGRADLLDGADYDNVELPRPDQLAEIRRTTHPAYLLRQKEHEVALLETGLTRAGNLPGIEVGLGSEIIGGEHYTGPRVGLSVPLWPNRNMVRLSVAKAEAVAAGRDASLSMLEASAMAGFEYMLRVKGNLAELRERMPAGIAAMAARALEEKEITLTDYFAMMESEYEVLLAVAALECEYHMCVARLTDHLLAGL